MTDGHVYTRGSRRTALGYPPPQRDPTIDMMEFNTPHKIIGVDSTNSNITFTSVSGEYSDTD